MWAFLAAACNPGISISPSWIVSSQEPLAAFNLIRFLVGLMFFSGVPGIHMVVVQPKSAHDAVEIDRGVAHSVCAVVQMDSRAHSACNAA